MKLALTQNLIVHNIYSIFFKLCKKMLIWYLDFFYFPINSYPSVIEPATYVILVLIEEKIEYLQNIVRVFSDFQNHFWTSKNTLNSRNVYFLHLNLFHLKKIYIFLVEKWGLLHIYISDGSNNRNRNRGTTA